MVSSPILLVLSLSILLQKASSEECRQKWFPDAQSFVCTCSAQFCDEFEQIGQIENGQIHFYYSEKGAKRLERSVGKFGPQKASKLAFTISVDPSVHFQRILGFGGAFSDAVGINLNALSGSTREKLLRAYFDPERGIGYSLGRVPIASTDFSTREYSYLDQERDFDLETFELAPEDLEAKIPHIKMAQKMSGRLRLFAAPWAAPGWMKSNGKMRGEGELKGNLEGPFYWAYARYLKRFLDEYSARGVDFWALTLQNQPESGLEKDFPFQAMFLSNHSQREFAARLLVPLLRESPHTAKIELIAFDDVREHLISSAREIFAKDGQFEGKGIFSRLICGNKFIFTKMTSFLPEFVLKSVENFFGCPKEGNGAKLISGIGVHWYTLEGHERQGEFHEMFPRKFILPTEACAGFLPEDQGPRPGNWTRGWMYGRDVLLNLRNWAVGWVDWNLCLNMEGGPNWANNFVDAPILVDEANDQFHKQPMFYFLAHFSRFIPPGSLRVNSSGDATLECRLTNSSSSSFSIEHVAFLTPNGQKVLVLISPISAENSIDLLVKEENGGENGATFTMEPGSILTAIWQ